MSEGLGRAGRAIESFIENPVTILVKGILLLFIGVSEAARTFHEDLAHKQLRVGHGLIVIGLFSILEALPHLLGSLEAGTQYVKLRKTKGGKGPGPGAGTAVGGPPSSIGDE